MNRNITKCSYLLAVVLFGIISSLSAGELALPETWEFKVDSKNVGIKEKWFAAETTGLTWEKIKTTTFWEAQGYPYDGYAWYRIKFTFPKDAAHGGKVIARFGAVDEQARIWCNGRFLDTVSKGWNVPFEIDLTPVMKYGQENTLTVQVFDSAFHGGIWKPVKIQYEDKSPAYEVVKRLKRQGVRAISSGIGADIIAKRILNAGLNTCLEWSYITRGAKPRKVAPGENFVQKSDIKRLDSLRNHAKLAKKHNLVWVPNIWFHTDTSPLMTANDYRRCVSVQGRVCKVTPCPLDEGFWDHLMFPLLEMLAEIEVQAGNQGGAVLDLEFYVGDFSGGFCYNDTAEKGCYCDHCFGSFLRAWGKEFSPGDFPLVSRSAYICEHYSFAEYLDFQEIQIARKIRGLSDKIRKIKPDFLLGILPGADNWYLRGVARGMSAPGMPALLFSEKEYRPGFCEETEQRLKWIKDASIPALQIGGLMLSLFNAEGLGAKAAELADRADGYWLYHGAILHNNKIKVVPDNTKGNEYILREPPVKYWEALKPANEWIDKTRHMKPFNPGRKINLRSAKMFKNLPVGSKITYKGIQLGGPAKKMRKVLNGQFTQPFTVGWRTFDQRPKIVKLSNGATRALHFDFASLPASPSYGSVFQTISVTPGKRYSVKVDTQTKGVQNPTVGFQIFRDGGSGVQLTKTLTVPSSDRVTLQGSFKADCKRVNLVLLAHGQKGQAWISNVRVDELRCVSLKTRQIKFPGKTVPGQLVVNFGQKESNTKCEVINPETKIGYFASPPGRNDLRYLSTIYPGLPLAVALNANVSTLHNFIGLTKFQIVYQSMDTKKE